VCVRAALRNGGGESTAKLEWRRAHMCEGGAQSATSAVLAGRRLRQRAAQATQRKQRVRNPRNVNVNDL
jgi:hypothetical protein